MGQGGRKSSNDVMAPLPQAHPPSRGATTEGFILDMRRSRSVPPGTRYSSAAHGNRGQEVTPPIHMHVPGRATRGHHVVNGVTPFTRHGTVDLDGRKTMRRMGSVPRSPEWLERGRITGA